MSESKANLVNSIEHMRRVVQEAAFLLELVAEIPEGDIKDWYFNDLRDAFSDYAKGM